jgi:hypothetical protein
VTSIAIARSPTVGTSADNAITIAAVTAAAFSCCDPEATTTSRDGSPVAARDALDERRLVVMSAPDLSALAGARAGTIGVTLRMKKHKDEHRPPRNEGCAGELLLTSSWRRPASYSSKVRGAPLLRPPAPPWRSRAPLLMAPATDANSTTASTACGDGGRGFHILGGPRPPSLSSSSSSDDDPAGVPGGESPCC